MKRNFWKMVVALGFVAAIGGSPARFLLRVPYVISRSRSFICDVTASPDRCKFAKSVIFRRAFPMNTLYCGDNLKILQDHVKDESVDLGCLGPPDNSNSTCNADEPGTVIDETINAGGSSLSYDASSGQYNYVWKTNKAWKGSCRIRLIDGTDHIAKFSFR